MHSRIPSARYLLVCRLSPRAAAAGASGKFGRGRPPRPAAAPGGGGAASARARGVATACACSPTYRSAGLFWPHPYRAASSRSAAAAESASARPSARPNPARLNHALSAAVWGQCSHCFHIHCIMKWLNSQQTSLLCPMCRQVWKFKE